MALRDFADQTVQISVADDAALREGAWVTQAKDALIADGAVLLRGAISGSEAAEVALGQIDDELLDDAFWSTPRSKVGEKTLTATEYPSPRTIALHSEMAYMRSWPRFVAFHSIKAADEGGETTVCPIDPVSRDVADVLPAFRDRGVMYRRNFQPGVDVSWQKAFQTSSQSDVEELGQRLHMTVEWLPKDGLATCHTAQGTIAAEDGTPILFNQAHLFHPSALGADVRQALERVYGDKLPRTALYGDGSPIPDADLAKVRAAFDAHQTRMCWRDGDILILDNMRFAHGRLPFKGARSLHVSLAGLVTEPVRTPLFA